jgi:hypothetical protein
MRLIYAKAHFRAARCALGRGFTLNFTTPVNKMSRGKKMPAGGQAFSRSVLIIDKLKNLSRGRFFLIKTIKRLNLSFFYELRPRPL